METKTLTLRRGKPTNGFRTMLGELVGRMQLATRMGLSFSDKRDLYNALGYPLSITYRDYLTRYGRQDIAKAVIDRPVRASWQGPVEVIESGKVNETSLEKEWRLLDRRLGVKTMLTRIDRLASIGQYGILLLGTGDVRQTEDFAKPVNSNKLVYLSPFGEGNAPIVEYDKDVKSPRYGKPLYYDLSVSDNASGLNSTVKVHYSRVIHIVLDTLESDVLGIPVLQSVWNRLMDLEKLVGGDAEMFWRGARPGYSGEVQPGFQMSDAALEDLKNQAEEWEHDLRRLFVNEGVTLRALEQQISDPSNHVDAQVQMISAVTGIPKRILTGSERGELSSDQDKAEWNTYVKARREEHCEPLIIRPFVDRLIELKILPKPAKGEYTVRWQDVFAASEKDRVDIGKSRAQALSYYAMSGAETFIPLDVFCEYFLGMTSDQIELTQEMRKKAMKEEKPLTPEEEALIKETQTGTLTRAENVQKEG